VNKEKRIMSDHATIGFVFLLAGLALLGCSYWILSVAKRSLHDALACLEEGRTIAADLVYDLAQEARARGDIGKPDGGVEAWVWLEARAKQFQAIHDSVSARASNGDA
jgi:hypothetical protein